MATQTFKEAYGVLQKHAQTLRNQKEPNIDDLLSIVTDSMDAYKVCVDRIDAVEKALEKALGNPGAAAATKDSTSAATDALKATSSASDIDAGDIPF